MERGCLSVAQVENLLTSPGEVASHQSRSVLRLTFLLLPLSQLTAGRELNLGFNFIVTEGLAQSPDSIEFLWLRVWPGYFLGSLDLGHLRLTYLHHSDASILVPEGFLSLRCLGSRLDQGGGWRTFV